MHTVRAALEDPLIEAAPRQPPADGSGECADGSGVARQIL
jgi:hypothetical protein